MGHRPPVVAGDCDKGHEDTDVNVESSGCQNMGTIYM